ncbi:MAG: hypothetical protein A4E60_00815 [Syntrophorhabdus sp. PtaB.Bin047]|nr:MAG: hypothetical protein A4E60_00815 [Syntrophorhabdus sp. PtaB.Bin047]
MSIDKIGKVDASVSVHQRQVHREPKEADKVEAVVHETGARKGDLTKISYPPFLPLGDTQSIYKK